ncbi:MAG: S16 family serine protease [Nitrososphaerales archaeon]
MDVKNATIYGLLAALILSAFLNYVFYNEVQNLNHKISTLQSTSQNNKEQEQTMPQNTAKTFIDNVNAKTITAVAVRQVLTNDFFQTYIFEGATLQITVEIKPGDGKILVNTITPTGVDFQSSARTAVQVAERMAKIDMSTSDIIFSISSNEDIRAVDGQSAGAAMTVLLISELTQKNIRTDVLITGTINPDGSIGKIGGVKEKAEVAGRYGAKIFLVPDGQSVIQMQTCEERQIGAVFYKNCRYEPANLSEITRKQYGMDVIEVSDVEEALSYFTKT